MSVITRETVDAVIVQFTIIDDRHATHIATAYLADDELTVLNEDGEAADETVAAVARQRVRQLVRSRETMTLTSHTSWETHQHYTGERS